MSLLRLKWWGLRNALLRGPKLGTLFILLFAALVVYAEMLGVLRGLAFLKGYPFVGLLVARNVFETGLIVLASGVTFSATTTAITTLYLSDDLHFLLAQPIAALRVFALKLLETFVSAAGVPCILTAPLMVAIGLHFGAPWWFYPFVVVVTLLVYTIPVGLGCALAVLLMRVAPAGRVKEVATALGVVLSAGLVYVIRASKPEDVLRQLADPDLFDALLSRWATPSNPLLPPAWAARAVWDGAKGELALSLVPLLVVALVVLGVALWLAATAYHEGWVRGLESSRVRLDPRPKKAGMLERALSGFGPFGVVVAKDARVLQRDATQWSQLLILVALALVYLVSVSAYPLNDDLSRNAIGVVQLAFQGFVIAGVGVRMAFPAVSQEGPGYWLLRTAPLRAKDVVLAKYWGALPVTLLLALVLALFTSQILKLTPMISFLSVVVATSSALAITAIGVGIGAALPRFKADNPSEVAVSPGGLLYMGLSLLYSILMVLLTAHPAYMSLRFSMYLEYFARPEGALTLGLLVLATVLGIVSPLVYGWRSLERIEA